MTESQEFQNSASQKALDTQHRSKILRVIDTYDKSVVQMKQTQFVSWEAARQAAAQIKDYSLANLAALLEQFESRIEARGAKVLWADNTEEAQSLIKELLERHAVTKVVKSKSMITEELELNNFLEMQGVQVHETDLGELIVQLAGERPYHIVTPAMHFSRQQVGRLFQERLGIPYSDNATVLAGAAREFLRRHFLNADCGITGVNFLLADQGALVITENEGNARLCMATPNVHIAIAGIEKILPSMSDLALFLPLLATSGTGQRVTAYNSIVFGPRSKDEIDGPEHLYVILLNNGRTQMYNDPHFREALRCIKCGACLNACPVYRSIGGHAYSSPYPGPIGAVVSPFLIPEKNWDHLAQASTLCGACSDVCPVKIPLHHLILRLRSNSTRIAFWGAAMEVWSSMMQSSTTRFMARNLLKISSPFIKFASKRARGVLPAHIESKSFKGWYAKRKSHKNP